MCYGCLSKINDRLYFRNEIKWHKYRRASKNHLQASILNELITGISCNDLIFFFHLYFVAVVVHEKHQINKFKRNVNFSLFFLYFLFVPAVNHFLPS